ncbi:unnamed protein product [Amoebophrya sp. A120]|nr:unnamed protein product [Amoebophrya sp. A120]|eukprot:GSA120T00010376001.1
MGSSLCSCTCCVTISADEIGVVEYFNKFNRLQPPGLACFPVPCMCQLAGTLSTRQMGLTLDCEAKTKDNVFVHIRLEVQYLVDRLRAADAFYKFTNVRQQIGSYVKDEVRSVICTRMLDEVFNDRDVLIAAVRARLTQVMTSYGYQLVAVLVQEIMPAAKVFQAMNQIETLRRLRQATTDQAEAEKMLVVKRAEGESERKRLLGVGMGRQRVALLRGMEMSMHKLLETDESELKRKLDLVHAQRVKTFEREHAAIRDVDSAIAESEGSPTAEGSASGELVLVDPAVASNNSGSRPRFSRRATMEIRTEARDDVAAHALLHDANELRMPTDVGVENTDSLFPPEALTHPDLIEIGNKAESRLKVSASDVMELLLIVNYFDMLKEVGTNDSASTIYVGHNPGTIVGMRAEIHDTFAATAEGGRKRKK